MNKPTDPAKPVNSTPANSTNLTPAEKRALLARLLKQQASAPKRFPLSLAQQRLWFLNQLTPNNPSYNIPAALRLQGALNIDALARSLNEIVRRHETLRTTFAIVDDEPMQIIAPSLILKIPIIELNELIESVESNTSDQIQREEAILRLARLEAITPFDLTCGPLLRASLIRLSQQEHVALFTMHHIISDGWSIGVLIREFVALYQAFSQNLPSPLPELPIQYADFANWQRNWLQAENLQKQLDYWRTQLSGSLPVLPLPIDYPRRNLSTDTANQSVPSNPSIQTMPLAEAGYYSFQLTKSLSDAIKALARQEGITLFIALLAAFETLLYRYTAQTDILIGTPIAGRNRVEVEPLIGFFINTLVLRVDLAGNPTFRELLARVREATRGAFAHQELPFERLVEELQPNRDLNETPFFQVMFVLQNIPPVQLSLPGLQLSALPIANGTAKFELTLTINESVAGLNCVFEYHRDRFDAVTIAALADHFNVLLSGIAANPDERIGTLPILTTAERAEMIAALNGIG